MYDQKHDVGDNLSQGVDIKRYTWLKDHKKFHCEIVSDDMHQCLDNSNYNVVSS